MHIHFVDSATKVEIAPRDQVLINGARLVQVILDHNVGRGMAPVDPTDHVQFETLDVNIKEKVVILSRHLDIGKADDFDIYGYNGLDIVVNVSHIIFPAESIPLDLPIQLVQAAQPPREVAGHGWRRRAGCRS